ncbi:pullulanase, extracellular [Alkalibacterium subtropicum]|uniref:Pullulanase, extracellular n=1 Tax=Alkalibacterium subtropicum TaxID=753702 RepID=A0A1I1KJA2_9LACT|nr:pullulanase, extracellular [Alkalibacterium subtropicum]
MNIFFDSIESLNLEEIKQGLKIRNSQGEKAAVKSLALNRDKDKVVITGTFNVQDNTYTVHFKNNERSALTGWKLKDSLYAYEGKLGACLHEDGTATLSVWAPSAEAVRVILYDKADQTRVVKTDIAMEGVGSGVWRVLLNQENTGRAEMRGYFYHYAIEREGRSVLALDPYASSLAAWNSTDPDDRIAKAAIVNPGTVGPELDYAEIEGYKKREDAVIYEIHVRDFTSDPSIENDLNSPFGSFSAFIEKLDYISSLGVTHIQLLPVMSYYFINELKNTERLLDYASNGVNYNWGYDPQSYFALTGMYSEDPQDPEKRIEEFKNLVAAIHQRGMGVILDVVYNHTAREHIFEDLEPNYYHFMDADGTPRTSFGGGRLGTTHAMARRILVDSVMHWVENYKVDGFRFDMMGDHDAESIQMAFDEAKKLNPDILMIGEGWRTFVGDEGDEEVMPADQDWMQHTDGVASFSDDFRNELKSGFQNEGEPSFLTGGPRSIQRIFDNLTARPHNFNAVDPGSVVPYIGAHDNLTLHDVIVQSIQKDPEYHQEEIHRRIRLGNLMVLTAQGIPFLHAGQEYGRTKQFRDDRFTQRVSEEKTPDRSVFMTDKEGKPFEYPYFIHDSVYSSDAVNRFDWNKAVNKEDYPIHTLTQAYTAGLIKLRKSTDAFRKGTLEEIENMVSLVDAPEISEKDLVIGYHAEDSKGDIYYVFVNADETPRTLTIDTDLSGAEVLADAETAGTAPISQPVGVTVRDKTVTLEALTAAVLVKRKE